MRTTIPLVAVLSALIPAAASAQTMYKCVQGERTVYQAEPCPDTAKQDKLKAQIPPPSSSGSAGGQVDRMVDFMSTYRACADGVQIWGQEMAQPYAQWRNRNLAMVTRIEKEPALKALFQKQVEAKRNGKASMCRPVALELRGVKQ
ncbi:MAG: DUF4124 domain-containing protein [Betaproteobacteria bacterium]|nr:DUF4124 domain-containing protein [Betaproteobacteria bacterium]